ncbi:hypothetical protein, partial [Klebsiella pneumoniae]|uniref:hypothetical protein n=1 Tax=Klebsiella pneumoniae TaxID=573 RepID=UPI0025A163CB
MITLFLDETIPDATFQKVARQLPQKERKSLHENLEIRRRQRAREHAPVRQGKRLTVPQLVRVIQGEME